MSTSAAEVDAKTRPASTVRARRPPGGDRRWLALGFLAPALVVMGAIVVYPTIDTFIQSFQNTDRQFVGFDNFAELAETERMVTAIKNNAIWVATAPAIITGLGLMFAILTERVRYATAIKVIVFMPMAISFLSTGVIWRIMYEQEPERGFVNAAIAGVSDTFGGPGLYPTAQPSAQDNIRTEGKAVVTTEGFSTGEVAAIGLTAIAPADTPEDAVQAVEPEVGSGELGVVVWRDFKPGGGEPGVVEQDELGLPNVTVELRDASGNVVATDETGNDGTVVFAELEGEGPYTPAVAASNFSTGFRGVEWLGSALVTPAIIGAFSWMWAGFAVVVIGAGLSALPRDVLEAARVDGANEWQTFRHVTLPLLAPVLGVVFITLAINVLKIFDIVLVLPPGASQDEANVIALEMWKTSFTDFEFGVGSAIAVVLFVLVVPVMVLNIRRFRRDM